MFCLCVCACVCVLQTSHRSDISVRKDSWRSTVTKSSTKSSQDIVAMFDAFFQFISRNVEHHPNMGLWMPLSTVHVEAGWSQLSLSSFCVRVVSLVGCCCIIFLRLKRSKDVCQWLKHPPDIDVYWMIWCNIILCSILSPYCNNDRQVSVLLLMRKNDKNFKT